MATEARRSLIRIASNYTRLFVNVCLGLILVRILLVALGNEAWGLIALLGATVGLAAMLQEIVNASMIRELGEAYHRDDDGHFRCVYNSAVLLTLIVGVVSVAGMAVLWMALPLLNIPERLLDAGRWMVMCKAVETFAFIAAAAPVNLLKVAERMVVYNACVMLDRASFLAAALALTVVYDGNDPAQGIRIYASLSALLIVVGKLLQVITSIWTDRRSIPAPTLARRDAVRSILQIGGWNTATVTAMNLHIRLDNLLMNLFFGLFGNVIFGLTAQLGSHIRVITMGMTEGIDAVSARISSTESDSKMQALLFHTTRLHGLVAIPAGIGMFLLAEPLLLAWVGDRLQNPAETLGPTVLLIRILSVGMVCRAIGDGWVFLLYGSGHVRRYAPAILWGGLTNPVLAIVLILILPDSISFTGPTVSYAAIFLVVHMVYIPATAGRILNLTYVEVLAPLARPALVSALCTPVIVFFPTLEGVPVLARLAMLIAAFGAVYVPLAFFVVLDRAERARIIRNLQRLTGRAGDAAHSEAER